MQPGDKSRIEMNYKINVIALPENLDLHLRPGP